MYLKMVGWHTGKRLDGACLFIFLIKFFVKYFILIRYIFTAIILNAGFFPGLLILQDVV